MAQSIREVMTHDPATVSGDASLVDAARIMAREDVGPVLVEEQGRLWGILTDRDIVVRCIAQGRDPAEVKAREVATEAVVTLPPDGTVEEAIRLMRENEIRRIPVVQDGRPAGIVAIGDLAVERDPDSALADISAAAPNN